MNASMRIEPGIGRVAACLLVASLALTSRAHAQAQATTPVAAAEPPVEWIDPDTGHRVIRLSTEPGTRSLYFHQNSVTPDGRFVIVASPGGISAIEIATRKTRLLVPGKATALFVGRKTGLVYFARTDGAGVSEQQTPTRIFTVAADGGKPREVAKIARGMIGSVNADETLLLGVFAERDFALETGPRDARFDANYAAKGPDGKPLTFADAKEVRLKARAEAKIPMEMFTVDLKTGEQRTIHRSTDWLNHLQFSPVDPALIMFCHEGPWHGLDRVWSMRIAEEQPHLVHRRTMNMEIAGHEFFDVNGHSLWYDLQTPRGEDFWLAKAEPDGTHRQWYHLERNQWSVHYNMAPDGSFFAADGGDAEMVAKASDGKWLYLFWPELIPDVAGISVPNADELVRPGRLRAERLVNMSAHDYRMEPNVIFTRDGKWVIFRSNMHGPAHVYMVEVAKASATTSAPLNPPLNQRLPTLFVAGDSTAATVSMDDQQGWGAGLSAYFDPTKLNVVNLARGGRSSRTFITEGDWDKLIAQVKRGDFVLVQFGHNDAGALNEEPPGSTRPLRARGTLPGAGEETQEIDNVLTHKHEVVHTFGWYLRKMIADVAARHATPILLSLTARNAWNGEKVECTSAGYRQWTADVARSAHVPFIDVTRIITDHYQHLGAGVVKTFFSKDALHTNLAGADANATSVVAGLRALRGAPFDAALSAKGRAVAVDRGGSSDSSCGRLVD
jgi:oligogalacturonide lyase